MSDPRLSNLAKVIVDYSVKIRAGDQVLITTTPVATPLVQELYRLIVQRGGHALPVVDLPGLNPIFFQYANDEQLAYVSPIMKYVMENFDVRLAIASQVNTRELSAADPAKLAARQRAMRPVSQTFMDRSASGALRWNVTLFPTDAYAQDAEMSLAEFEDFVYSACLCDLDDPVAAWREVDRKQQILVDYLKGKTEIHLVGEDTDVKVGIAGRTFVNCSGDKNMPDGEVFTGPEETRVNGHVRFSFPAIYQSREVSDVRVWFEDGVAVRWSAAKNEDLLTQMLMTDEGSRRLGEFAFGTNFGIQRFIKNILFDEKIGGTIHMALGRSYEETKGVNQSAIHWDMIHNMKDGGEIWIDGTLFYRAGEFMIG